MKALISSLIIAIWFFLGFLGISNCQKNKTNWAMIIFCTGIPILGILGGLFL